MGPLYLEAGETRDRRPLFDFKTLQAQGAWTLQVDWRADASLSFPMQASKMATCCVT